MKECNAVGKSVPRIDAWAKATGAAKYVGDMQRPNMLHAKILRSPLAHAWIKQIDVGRAAALPGVHAVITYKDVPQIPYTSCGHPHPPDTPQDCLILSRHLRYVGDPVAAVAADTPEIALDALELIAVEYEALPAYFTMDAALEEGAVELHAGLKNLAGENVFETGDVQAAMAQADVIVEDTVETPIVTHSPIEPHVSLMELDEQDRLVCYLATQVPSIMRERLSTALGMRMGQIRVVKGHVGGGFGGKQEPIYEPINAVLTLKTGRPVRLELTREESLACTRTRHSARVHMRTGLTREGKILAREMEIDQNTGAYASHGHNVVFAIAMAFATLYPTPNLRFYGRSVYTNILIAGAMRAYGCPQYAFAMESHVEHMARELGIDSLEFRRKNSYHMGDPINFPHVSVNTCGLQEAIDKCAEAIGYQTFLKAPRPDGPVKRGIGTALLSYGQSCYPHSVELSGARVRVNEDATATLYVGCAEIGQGTDTVMAQIAAEALGIPFADLNVVAVDTDVCPFDPGAYASRQTYVAGHAVKKAAAACKEQILRYAVDKLSVNYERLDAQDGWIIDCDAGKRLIPMRELTMRMHYDCHTPVTICHDASFAPTDNLLTFGISIAIVNVDTATGKVEVEKLITVLDSGRIINPQLAMGQLNGGNIMSLGYGLFEQLLIDPKTGRVYNDNLLDYKVPTFADVPELEGYFIETDEPSSAYGNKSLGEPPNIAPAAAVRNAVLDATGVAVNQGPLTPERVYLALKAAKKLEV
ncbi:MAG: xanthine dehydrogenase subunit XdhA [Bacillota bacterium]